MPAFMYRCPNTGYRARGYTPNEIAEESKTFEAVLCTVCQQLHRVNPATSEVAAEQKDS